MFSISRIQEVLQAVPRGAFDQIVSRHGANRYSKGFGSWQHLLAMVYAQLSGASSLRELLAGFNAHPGHHYHLNSRAIARSTLSDANSRRNPEVFADLLKLLIEQAGRRVRHERQELLYLLDATSVRLPPRARPDLRGHASAHGNHGMKLHVLLQYPSAIVASASITRANVNDLTEGQKLTIEPQATYVFDKGYCDYSWWHAISERGARWVTRFRRGAAVKVVRERAVSGLVLKDQIVVFRRLVPRGGHRNPYSGELRRIEIERENAAPLVFATNDLDSPAEEIAQLYKQRWAIELLFKWVKQHLQIKKFVGCSENAMRIQLLTALIAYMLVALLQQSTASKDSLWLLLAELRATLFQRQVTELSYWRRRQAQQKYIASVQGQLFPKSDSGQ